VIKPRIVRCQYGQDPHPLDDECINVTDVDPSVVASAAEAWAAAGNGDLIADLRRVALLNDPHPPVTACPPARFDDGLPCCDLHNRFCEPPGDLCCRHCTECAHPGHLDGSMCVIGVRQ